jgi:hypothetical protein
MPQALRPFTASWPFPCQLLSGVPVPARGGCIAAALGLPYSRSAPLAGQRACAVHLSSRERVRNAANFFGFFPTSWTRPTPTCSPAEVERVIVGAGGGKVPDTARAAADLDLSVVSCPAVAPSDAPCSALLLAATSVCCGGAPGSAACSRPWPTSSGRSEPACATSRRCAGEEMVDHRWRFALRWVFRQP